MPEPSNASIPPALTEILALPSILTGPDLILVAPVDCSVISPWVNNTDPLVDSQEPEFNLSFPPALILMSASACRFSVPSVRTLNPAFE